MVVTLADLGLPLPSYSEELVTTPLRAAERAARLLRSGQGRAKRSQRRKPPVDPQLQPALFVF